MPKRKKSDRQKAIEKLDKLVADAVRKRDNFTCQKCGKYSEKGLHCSHVIPRTNLALRWNLANLKTLCVGCHLFWWHKNPLEASEWFRNKFPDRYELIEDLRNEITKYTLDDLLELQQVLKRI